MSLSSLDHMAKAMAVWFLSKMTAKLKATDAKELERLIEFFRHMDTYTVTIEDDEQLNVSCVSRSWLPGATDGDKVLCTFSFNGVFVVFDVYIIVPGDHGLILRIETDFKGDVTGQAADFFLFSAVVDKVLADSKCTLDVELPRVVLSK